MSKRESKNLEYKLIVSNTFLKTMSAYANYGDGKIIFGINDNGEKVGLEGNLKQLCLDIENKINDNLKPIPKYSLGINEKDKTIKLHVFEGLYKPYLYKNKAYKRHDSSTIEVDRIDYNRLILEGLNQSFEELVSDNQNLEFSYLERKLIEELNIDSLNKDILKTLNLYSDKLGYNKAAEILADKNKYSGLYMVRFGKNIDELLDREVIENTSIIKQYDKAVEMFQKYYINEVIDGFERRIVELIPEKAFREAIANSIIHRVWDVKTSINISMHKDKIEITSPGGLPTGISKEEYLYGQISVLRNPILANVFFRLRYVEKFGTGIKRINNAYEKSIVKPEYKIYENSIVVILPVFNESMDFLNVDEKIILDLLKSKGSLNRLSLEQETGFGKDKVIRLINNLIDKNIIKRRGKGRSVKYEVL